jgi:hypothetical protein
LVFKKEEITKDNYMIKNFILFSRNK